MTNRRAFGIAALVGLLPIVVIVINLAARWADFVAELWHIPLVMGLYWSVTTALAFVVLRVAGGVAPHLMSRLALLLTGHPDWPRPGEFRVRSDPETGLPIVEWCEEWQTAPRRCFVHQDVGTGELLFACQDPRPSAWSRPTASWSAYAILATCAAVPLLAMALRTQSYRYGEEMPPLLVFLGMLMLELVALAIALGTKAVHRRWQLVKGQAPSDGRTLAGPWLALEGFLLSDEKALYGKAARDKDGRELPTNRVLLAVFGLTVPRFEVSNYRWSADTMSELNRVLNLEFIAKRAEHVARLNIGESVLSPKAEQKPGSDIPQRLD